MPATRTAPVSSAHRELRIRVGGAELPLRAHLLSASIASSANRIATARLVLADGSAARGDFPLASGSSFAPGASIELFAGPLDDTQPIFTGLVVRLRIRAVERGAPQLVVDCRHAATRLATTRRAAAWADVRDSDVIEQLLGAANVPATVAATAHRHTQLVQHDISDWDFLVTRAEANGLAVFTRSDGISVRRPSISGAATAELVYGHNLLAYEAESDAREQPLAVHTLSWDAADQALRDDDASAPDFAYAGNADPDDLARGAGAERVDLRHSALDSAEAQALADAHWLRARVNLVSGRASCTVQPQVQPGDVVDIQGVGARFSGEVLVTAVRHELDGVRGFVTHLQFGGLAPDPERIQRLNRPRAAALGPAVPGLQIGVVTALEDPSGEARVRVRLPLVDAQGEGVWARVASLDAGADRGWQMRPEIGDEVVLGFLDDDPRHPVVLGMLHSSAKPPPLPLADDNDEKGYVSRSGMRLHFDDRKAAVTLSTPGGHSLLLDDEAGAVTLQDSHGNKIVLDAQGVRIESATALQLSAATQMQVEASSSLALKAQSSLSLEGSASAELKAGGMVRVQGGLVQIN
jgi:Rhs element Vgr protein